MKTPKATDTKALRLFGFLWSVVFAAVGTWPAIRHGGSIRIWAAAIAMAFVAVAAIRPGALRFPHRIWVATGYVVGSVMTRIVLGLVFFFVFTPIGLIKRLCGYDPLKLHFDKAAKTYRLPMQKRDRRHFELQF